MTPKCKIKIDSIKPGKYFTQSISEQTFIGENRLGETEGKEYFLRERERTLEANAKGG